MTRISPRAVANVGAPCEPGAGRSCLSASGTLTWNTDPAPVQLGNVKRDRAKGLSLVDRLAKLLDCPVTLRSAPVRHDRSCPGRGAPSYHTGDRC